jgi:hypothetical protein
VTGNHAAIQPQSRDFGPFGAATLAPGTPRCSTRSEEFSTIGRFEYIQQSRGMLARLVRLINTAILGTSQPL